MVKEKSGCKSCIQGSMLVSFLELINLNVGLYLDSGPHRNISMTFPPGDGHEYMTRQMPIEM